VRATAIIPVKRFTAAKQRLDAALEPQARESLAAAMLGDVLAAVERSSSLERVIVVSDEPGVRGVARAPGVELLGDPSDADHSRAAARGVEEALGHDADAVVLLPGDCPLLDPDELDAALSRVAPKRVGIVPDRHGTGTNALLLAPPDAIEPAFGEDSRARHERLARAAGEKVAIERLDSLALDVDTPDDLAALREVLSRSPGRAPRTAALLHAPAEA
jgi:2-phospho-L-lactate/phosphoenolpyruvate guanylyltransferase